MRRTKKSVSHFFLPVEKVMTRVGIKWDLNPCIKEQRLMRRYFISLFRFCHAGIIIPSIFNLFKPPKQNRLKR